MTRGEKRRARDHHRAAGRTEGQAKEQKGVMERRKGTRMLSRWLSKLTRLKPSPKATTDMEIGIYRYLSNGDKSSGTACQDIPAPSTGELQLQHLFPWISCEVAQLVYNNCLPPHNLGKLQNPAKLPALVEAEPGVVVNSICVGTPEPSAADTAS